MIDPTPDPVPMKQPDEPKRWLDHPRNVSIVYWSVVVAYALLLVASVLPYPHHPHFAFEQVPGFQGLFGLAGSIGLVLGAAWLRRFLMRPEDYYDEP